VAGAVDVATADALAAHIEAAEAERPATVVVDLREVSFIDSTGLRVLVQANARAREARRRLVGVQGADSVRWVLRTTRLDQYLDVVDDWGPDSG
jgi:anti-sigma B factor antagonist